MALAPAIGAGLRRALEDDERVVIMGEDLGRLGGVFRVTDGLQKDFGERRVIDTPLAESGIIGTAFGMALRGKRPVCEIQFDGFVYPAFDQIVTQVAKIHNRTRGLVRMPLTIRIPFGGGIGAVEHHSESPEAYFAHTAGIRVVSPATPSDGYWMTRQAIAAPDPVIVFEPKRRYWEKAPVDFSTPPPEPLGGARLTDLGNGDAAATIVTYGALVSTAVEAAETAAPECGVEIIDLRSLSPIDFDTIEASVRRTGRLVVAHEAPVFMGLGAEIAARITERCFYRLEAPVTRVGGFHTPYPAARAESHYVPGVDRILDALDQVLAQ
ncbi:alpha-ketoacid dehydrogenase subunit beta [Tomitella gaofuii]|uniref:alpha-ketoacid dehydrogenase subunit beta n=1 Tax=Tomitella gaofuii TaxID=2760083 RepID=UPI001C70FAE8|nr:transketolase C-terminal domain-containing protein [Tomitella gaofuii]